MSQEYTPTTWVDETSTTRGTLINAERMNNLETAHHYADGWTEVDAVPTANPGVDYHQVVYCTADGAFYRWNGTAWEPMQATGPMVFKGTLGSGGTIESLPAASSDNEGWTYKVITAGTYQGVTCKAGDLVVSNGTVWVLIPSGDEPLGTVTQVTAGTGLTTADGDPITSSGTISVVFGTAADTVCEGDDSRLSDARTPTSHTHGNITNDGKLGTTADKVVVTGTGGVVEASAATLGNTTTPLYLDAGQLKACSVFAPASTTYTKSEVDSSLAGKANTATTLGGYGITDAYTRTQADAAFQPMLTAGAGIAITSNVIRTTALNLTVSSSEPTSGDGADGDVWVVVE